MKNIIKLSALSIILFFSSCTKDDNIIEPSVNDDIDRGQMSDIYYKEKDLERIKIYCQKDTLTVAQLLLRYKGEKLIKEENIEFA